MIIWENADQSDLRLLKAISILFDNNFKLLEFFFNSREAKLCFSAHKMREDAQIFSSGEYLLVRIALDIWSGEGSIHFNEIYQTLDSEGISNVLKSLQFLSSQGDGQRKLPTSMVNSGQ